MNTKRRCFVDLVPTRINTLCMRLAVGEEKGTRTAYKRMVLFEEDLEQFAPAFFKAFNAYKKHKAQKEKARQPRVQQTLEFPA